MDKNSHANINEIVVTNVSLDLQVDFTVKRLKGSVELTLLACAPSVAVAVLDSKDLDIKRIEAEDGKELSYTLGAYHEAFGSPLSVTLAAPATPSAPVKIRVFYETTDKCTAVQWLAPSQTAGKEHPYLFTQCQAIHCRTMVPLQDSPGVKSRYQARITVPAPLQALMSADVCEEKAAPSSDLRVFQFSQSTPIPSYLIALAVGNLESREIGPRTRVWSEASQVDAAAYEFAETERFIATGEELLTPYCWGRYDILLLPPSFPYGGMENPCLTFVTPTLLAGDRSLANVVAHEIAHSWMGNLVTNRTWEHFWLNEGWTVWVERKILGRMFGAPHFHLHALIGFRDLKASVEQFGENSPLTALRPDLTGIDPDDAFSSIPYEKGFNFLYYLENLVGGAAVFEPFVKAYVTKFSYSTVTSDEFKAFFLEYFTPKVAAETLASIQWDNWFNAPGMPNCRNHFDASLVDAAHQLAARWLSGEAQANASAGDLAGWSSNQTVLFLDRLLEASATGSGLSLEALQLLDQAYAFFKSKNSEIRFRWCTLCLRQGWAEAVPYAVAFLLEQGRMKFVRPLYRTLFQSSVGGRVAVETFQANKDQYHSIARKMVAKDLNLDEQ